MPVTLERKSVRSGFTLTLHEDEPRFNPTLLEMLRQDFKLALPVVEVELPKDERGLNIRASWTAVQSAVRDIKGWEVTEKVVLSTFSFAKHLMWKDLVDRTDQLKQNPVVRHLIETPRDPYASDVTFPDPRTLDRDHGPEATFCPLPADSSQLSAVMAAAKGKDLVLVGPPGTGKSQTIANLIAQCLAEKKSVLFVSEKIAALDVVYRRLRDVGLGDFCLELHSSNARKLDVLEQLRKAWDAKGDVDAAAWRLEANRLKALRDHLNVYVERLHHRHRNGISVHQAIGTVVAGRNLPDIGLSWPSPDAHDPADLDGLRDLADRLGVNLREVGRLDGHPLAVVAHGDWSPGWQQTLVAAAGAAIPVGESAIRAASAFTTAAGLPDPLLDARRRRALADLSTCLPDAFGRDWRFALRPDVRRITDRLAAGLGLVTRHRARRDSLSPVWTADRARDLRTGCALVAKHRELAASLSVPYAPASLSALDTPGLLAEWKRAEQTYWPLGWLRRRAIARRLTTAVESNSVPVVADDLARLADMRRLEREINALGHLRDVPGVPWRGLATVLADAEAALSFQAVKAAALAGEAWADDGLAAVAAGRCGEGAAVELETIRAMASLEREIAELRDLTEQTSGLWRGLASPVGEIEAALRFCASLSASIAGLASTAEGLAVIRPVLEPAGRCQRAAGRLRAAGGGRRRVAGGPRCLRPACRRRDGDRWPKRAGDGGRLRGHARRCRRHLPQPDRRGAQAQRLVRLA